MDTKFGRVGLIGRFKPLHNGNSALLESVCRNSDSVIIGIGSSNKYDLRNPFSAKESIEMIETFLSSKFANYSFIELIDFGNDKKWKSAVISHFGNLDYFITGNAYVTEILKDTYKILHPFEIVPEFKESELNSSKVRIEIAKDRNWKPMVPASVANYLQEKKIIERFKREFGKQTLEYKNSKFYKSAEEEKMRILGAGV
ncbi:Nicotinamide-nucleotide adenylyltransferase [uncultured archaeon]|nr:Nicotinamide-nucleotide adenylyltransferase [uncultured archaeon]